MSNPTKKKLHKFKRRTAKKLETQTSGDTELGANKFRDVLRDGILRHCTKFNKDEAKKCLKRATLVVDKLIDLLKGDPLFKRLYQYTYNSGSYFKGTKVSTPREFDFNLVFRIPMQSSVWKHEEVKGHDYLTGYGAFCFEGTPKHLEEVESTFETYSVNDKRKQRGTSPSKSPSSQPYQFEKWLLEKDGEKYYLSQVKIRKWMQSLVDKVIKKLKEELLVEDLEITVQNKRSGPAMAFSIHEVDSNDESKKKKKKKAADIDVDIVPVIKYQSLFGKAKPYKLPEHINKQLFEKKNGEEDPIMIQAIHSIFLVPKRPPDEIFSVLDEEQKKKVEEFAWRFSFPGLEKAILYDKGCVKTLIRLFKVLRDKQKWDKISSYFIETIFYWKINAFPTSDKWSEWKLGQLFLKMVKEISETLEKQTIPHFFFPKMNLLTTVNAKTVSSIANFLKNINTQTKNTENNIHNIFKVERTVRKVRTGKLITKSAVKRQDLTVESLEFHSYFSSLLSDSDYFDFFIYCMFGNNSVTVNSFLKVFEWLNSIDN